MNLYTKLLLLTSITILLWGVPASALHDTPICQGTVTGYILIGQNSSNEELYLFMVKDVNSKAKENVICLIPGTAKVTIIVSPGKPVHGR